jgi:hypothetical protein
MSDFKGMTPELQAYLDYKGEGDEGYLERKRLRGLIQPGLYRAYCRFEVNAAFVTENEMTGCHPPDEISPSGKYKLVFRYFGTKPGCWSYTQGKVFRVGLDEPIAVVNRNYSSFPFEFIEGHPNGHPYLVCGENYQGQTVIELDTGKRLDFLPNAAEEGFGFCWAMSRFDAATQLLIVWGCYWACPYECRIFDFSDPMEGWPELKNENGIDDDSKWPTIEPDGTIKCYQTERTDDKEDEAADVPKKEPAIVATKTFRREGLKLILVEEWVSDEEKKVRADREEGNRKYEQWFKDFKANDPLYLLMQRLVKDPIFKPEESIGVGVTYDGWCPDFKGDERRICSRIHQKNRSNSISLDLQWGAETAPIKLVAYHDNKHVEDKWFEHSVGGMTEAFTYAKTLLGNQP